MFLVIFVTITLSFFCTQHK